MKTLRIRQALARYYHKPTDTILLEVIEGTPRSEEGGVWIEMDVQALENTTEKPDFDRNATGLGKYLDKWFAEGLITAEEKETGKALPQT